MSINDEQQIEGMLQRLAAGTTNDYEAVVQQLAPVINECIHNDFERLVQLLYRVDVDEKKLKQSLQSAHEEDAGVIIARLMVERHIQKLAVRQSFANGTHSIPEEDKW